MQNGKISLCGEENGGHNIKSDEDKSRILRELENDFGVKIIKRHHDRFSEAKHVPLINAHPYMACVRSNGNPYYLYLTRIEGVSQCVLVDKKVQAGYHHPRMILVRLWFDDPLFDNTLMEGEMVRERDDSWTFLMHDLLALENTPLTGVNLVRRINMLYEVLGRGFRPDALDVCRIEVKRYVPCHELAALLRDVVPHLPYTCRGIYFKPFFLGLQDVLLNFDDALVVKNVKKTYKDTADFLTRKDLEGLAAGEPVLPTSPDAEAEQQPQSRPQRPQSQHSQQSQQQQQEQQQDTKTFWVRKTPLPDGYDLYEEQGDAIRAAGGSKAYPACVPSLQTSKFLRAQFAGKGLTEVICLPCVYNSRFDKWAPLPN